MKKRCTIVLITILSISCEPYMGAGIFKILPQPQEWEIKGKSNLKISDFVFHHSPTSHILPPGSDFLGGAKPTSNIDLAQLVYSIDPELDLKAEGYILNITMDQVLINAKDQAGLIYGLATLEQLIEDAKDQGV